MWSCILKFHQKAKEFCATKRLRMSFCSVSLLNKSVGRVQWCFQTLGNNSAHVCIAVVLQPHTVFSYRISPVLTSSVYRFITNLVQSHFCFILPSRIYITGDLESPGNLSCNPDLLFIPYFRLGKYLLYSFISSQYLNNVRIIDTAHRGKI